MGDFFSQNWGTLLGGGTVTGFLGWLFYGRKNNDIDYLTKQQAVFDKLQEEIMKDRDYYKQEYLQARKEHKEEVLYFRNKIDEVTARADTLQGQFNNMSVSYTKEVEVSQNWEKLYRELSGKYDDLSKKYDAVLSKLKIVEKNQK